MMNSSKIIRLIFIFSILISISSYSQVRLPKLISDGMVLQRNAPVKIWGWSAKDEKISLHFIDSTYHITADSNGSWSMTVYNLKAGGPYTMTITASNSITIHDIMVGDVWVASGQSNMEHTLGSFSWVYKDVIANSKNEYIREFNVPETYNFNKPQKDFSSGSWEIANPENVMNFSAVAYFFGKYIYEKYKIPVGLINSSLGGSPAESWLSKSALKEFPKYYEEAQKFKDSSLIKKIQESDSKRINGWYSLLNQKDEGFKTPGKFWYAPSLNTSDWDTIRVPGYWAGTKLDSVNGVVWYRKKVNIPSSMAGKKGKIILGRIVDADSVFINGRFVGTTSYQYPRRRYHFPPGILKEGENTVAVRVISNIGVGGFVPDKPYEIVVGDKTVNLKGEWKYKIGAEMPPLQSQTFIRWKPEGLYNAMLAPLLNYRIKGVIWYQGESNAERPVEYRKLFPALIRDWREHWHEGNFPFLFVQLPNFMEAKKEPSESNWALLREAQLEALSIPNTGMAVTIDIGEWNDIHPVDKKDVGKRLALAAERLAYGDTNVVYSGPIYKSMKIEGNQIILFFTHTGSGLMAKESGKLGGFAIAGPDKHFVWANAKIEGNKIVVWNDKINDPVAVRYAWADNPENANLYNKEGLPASPFRTDDFSSVSSSQTEPALKNVFKNDFLIGTAVNRRQISGEDTIGDEIIKTQFNSITPENVLKWGPVHPKPGVYNFKPADEYVAFGEKNHMFIIGHTLVWHSQTPKWVFQDSSGNPLRRQALLKRMHDHIHTVVGRYKGKIKGWDVVNEALNEDGSLRQSPWMKIIGEDYIEKAFEYAHEADPDAELYYNDYSLENKPKRAGAIKLINKLKSEGIHISGIGDQMHAKMDWPSVSQVDSMLSDFEKLGIKVMITELDIDALPYKHENHTADISLRFQNNPKLNPYKNGLPDSVNMEIADRYAGFFKTFIKYKRLISRVTFWGVRNSDSWLNNWPIPGRTNYPLLFDRSGKPNLSFQKIIETAENN